MVIGLISDQGFQVAARLDDSVNQNPVRVFC